jgi:hypothetical protein
MEMPKATANHEKLRALAGSWTGEETMLPSPWDPKGGMAKGFIDGRVDLEGMWVITDYRQERDGKVTYRGHGVFGWDGKANAYTMYWFDSMGSDPGGAAHGKWEGDTLTFEMKGAMGHSRYTYRFEGDGRYAFSIAMSQDGTTWKPWIESNWIRS